MELLSYGKSVGVIEPDSLYNEMKSELWLAYQRKVVDNFEGKINSGRWAEQFNVKIDNSVNNNSVNPPILTYIRKGLEQ